MNIPKSCGICRYGNTYDMSVDDLFTYCYVLDYGKDWCDFPNRADNTLRMRGCPLPDITDKQFKMAEHKIEIHEKKRKYAKKMMKGKTKLIRTRNIQKLIKLNEKCYTGTMTIEWFLK